MKNGDLITLYETLQRLCQDREIKFSVPVGYALIKNKEKLRQEAMLIYDMRRKIIMEHGIITDEGIVVEKEFIEETNKKINELMEIQTEIELTSIPITAFENLNLSLEDINGLSVMLHETVQFDTPDIIV